MCFHCSEGEAADETFIGCLFRYRLDGLLHIY